LKIKRLNEMSETKIMMKTFEKKLKGIDLMNYINLETEDEPFFEEKDSVGNIYVGLHLSHQHVLYQHMSEFTIEKTIEWITDIRLRVVDCTHDFKNILAALNDEEAMELYMDSKELGLL